MVTVIPFSNEDQEHKQIQETLTKLKRAVRFSVNEAILRNVMVRIKFDLTKEQVEYSVEYGSSANLVLPENQDLSRLSSREIEEIEERNKDFESQFSPVDEFLDEPEQFDADVQLYGIGTTYYNNLLMEGILSIYFYPTGEKDSAIIIINNQLELAALDISPFEDRLVENFYPYTEAQLSNAANFDSMLESEAEKIYQEWQKE